MNLINLYLERRLLVLSVSIDSEKLKCGVLLSMYPLNPQRIKTKGERTTSMQFTKDSREQCIYRWLFPCTLPCQRMKSDIPRFKKVAAKRPKHKAQDHVAASMRCRHPSPVHLTGAHTLARLERHCR